MSFYRKKEKLDLGIRQISEFGVWMIHGIDREWGYITRRYAIKDSGLIEAINGYVQLCNYYADYILDLRLYKIRCEYVREFCFEHLPWGVDDSDKRDIHPCIQSIELQGSTLYEVLDADNFMELEYEISYHSNQPSTIVLEFLGENTFEYSDEKKTVFEKPPYSHRSDHQDLRWELINHFHNQSLAYPYTRKRFNVRLPHKRSLGVSHRGESNYPSDEIVFHTLDNREEIKETIPISHFIRLLPYEKPAPAEGLCDEE